MTALSSPVPHPHGDVRQHVRRAAIRLLLGTALALTACGPDSPPTERTQEATPVADPEAVLQDQAAQLRTIVDDAVTRYPAEQTPVIGDDDTACDLPAEGRWPRRWSYGRRLFAETPDARTVARQAAERFETDGWSVRQAPADENELRFTAQKDGFVISIAGLATGGTWQLLGSSPCVKEDGTLDRSGVS